MIARPSLSSPLGCETTQASAADLARASVHPSEAEKLESLAQQATGDGVLVEVGSFAGGSALRIVAGQRAAGLSTFKLYCIDNFERGTESLFRENLSIELENDCVELVIGDSKEVARTWPSQRKIKYLFLDGDHRYQAVKLELELFLPHLLPGAIVILHDCFYRNSDSPAFQTYYGNLGVSKVARTWLAHDTRFDQFERTYSMLSFRFWPDPAASPGTADERSQFIVYLDGQTRLDSLSRKCAYATYVLLVSIKRAADRLRLTTGLKQFLRLLGIRRLFGVVIEDSPTTHVDSN